MNFDELIMHRCLALAANGAGAVAPNPMVGSVIVHEGKIIGEGYHQYVGKAHAEINALDAVKPEHRQYLPDAVLFVNLEPCNHTGKTPPCTERIIKERIKKVVIGQRDPNPLVSGSGVSQLQSHGIDVVENVLNDACRKLNQFFNTFHELQRPWVTIKWAESADHFVSALNGKPVRFTNHFADKLVHKWRSEHAGILVGGKTIITDDPQLTVRYWEGKNPLRIVINSKDEMNSVLRIFNRDANTLLFNFDTETTEGHIKKIKINRGENLIKQAIQHLYELNINSVLVEGGPKTIQQFIDAGIWDEARIFISAVKIESGIPAPALPGKIIQTEEIFDNLLITTRPS